MFTDRVNIIMNLLHAKNADFSDRMGCDRSNVSRLRSGARVPSPKGVTTRQFCRAVCTLAEERGCVDALCNLVGADPEKPQALEDTVRRWLFDGSKPLTVENEQMPMGTPYHIFGERLSAAMELTDLSNIRFSRELSIDASHLSRFRRGHRAPRPDSTLMHAISDKLYARAVQLGKIEAFAQLLGVSPAILADPESGRQALNSWLCDFSASGNGPLAQRFAGSIDALRIPAVKRPIPSDIPPYTVSPLYYGDNGLRQAVLRFLWEAATRKADHLLLYSDQKMDWLTDDPVFQQQWAQAMIACVQSGTRIRIIHNLDRNMQELLAAINGWLPLYLSGNIESFYCRKLSDPRFAHTLFLSPKTGCITACNVIGKESVGVYYYLTDISALRALETQYDGLLHLSKSLLKVYRGGDYLPSGTCRISSLEPSISLATMPEEALNALLERSDAPKSAKNAAYAAWKQEHSRLDQAMREGYLFECAPLASPEAVAAGSVFADLRGISVPYDSETYAMHTEAIRSLLMEHTNYRFYPLDEPHFSETRVLLGDQSVSVSRLSTPSITFSISHPIMRDAFSIWLGQLMQEHRMERSELFAQLRRY